MLTATNEASALSSFRGPKLILQNDDSPKIPVGRAIYHGAWETKDLTMPCWWSRADGTVAGIADLLAEIDQ